jgi:hypothetical protein
MDWCNPSELPRPVFDVTKRSMELMPELTFGGFDVIVTPSWGARVVEVNSAPLMTPETTRKYVEFFNNYVNMQTVNTSVVGEDPTETADYQRGRRDALQEVWENLQRMFSGSVE